MRCPRIAAAACAQLVIFTAPLWAQTKVESVVVALATHTPSTFDFTPVSKTGLRGLSLAQMGSRFAYTIDGVEGPRFDRVSGMAPVITDDGMHHAYTATVGTDAIMVIDGKEVARVPAKNGQTPFIKYGFSKTGKRSWFVQAEVEKDRNFYERLTVDGKTVGDFAGYGTFVFSPDESRYAVLVTKHLDRREFLVLDGKDVGFAGDSPQFSPDGKNVITIGRAPDNDVLIINGGQASRAAKIHSVHMSAGGLNLLVLSPTRSASGDQAKFLGTGGKKLAGSECSSFEKITFSPDGKRYAALCSLSTGQKFLYLDGKRGLTYDQILDFQFTPDSSKAIYVDGNAAVKFARLPLPSVTNNVAPWELGADGVFTFLAEQDGVLKRFRVTPGADTSIGSFLASAASATQKK